MTTAMLVSDALLGELRTKLRQAGLVAWGSTRPTRG
jgi:hypothetical protein